MDVITNITFFLFRNDCSKMSISLISLFVEHDGPASQGLNLRTLGSRISMYSDFCVSTAFFYFLRLVKFW